MVKSIKLSDGTTIPWLAFGTGTALYKQDCTDATSLALSLGLTHIDAAQMYENEDGVGTALSASGLPRSALYITTKLNKISEGETVESTLRSSLKKLKVDHVDLFLVHVPTQHTDLKKVWKDMAQLEEIISLGLENPVVNQIEYHPLVADKLAPLIAFSREHGITTASYGGLTPILPSRIKSSELSTVRENIISTLTTIGSTRGSATPNQILLKWLQSQGVIAVTTSSKESRLKEYLDAENLAELSEEELDTIRKSIGGVHFRAFASFSHMDENN
ncbi:Aldo keto reductase [Pyrrhoderma noxium]|uniref:Aldo keto reductase n=1 Tax=Pyrrhoderma noxium TaxID=2282107 RepID=A0A286UDF0_9AGAM|nr:Aldo keto reductase [Pyrrhoderma noxium]